MIEQIIATAKLIDSGEVDPIEAWDKWARECEMLDPVVIEIGGGRCRAEVTLDAEQGIELSFLVWDDFLGELSE